MFTPTWGNDPIWLIFLQMDWNHHIHSLKLTARTWKWMVGRRSFPFGMTYFQGLWLLVSGRVVVVWSLFRNLDWQGSCHPSICHPWNLDPQNLPKSSNPWRYELRWICFKLSMEKSPCHWKYVHKLYLNCSSTWPSGEIINFNLSTYCVYIDINQYSNLCGPTILLYQFLTIRGKFEETNF